MTQPLGSTALEPMMVVRQSKLFLGARMVVVHFFFFVSCAIFLAAFDTEDSWFRMQGFLWFNLVELMVIFYAVLRWHNHYYLIRPDKILTSRGVFLHRQRFFAIKNIESISVRQGIIGKMFNFGTLHLYAPTLNHRIHMFGINDPCGKEQIIEKLLPDAGTTGGKKRDVLIVPGRKG